MERLSLVTPSENRSTDEAAARMPSKRIAIGLVLAHAVLAAFTYPGEGASLRGAEFAGYVLGEVIAGLVIYVAIPGLLVVLPAQSFSRFRSRTARIRLACGVWAATLVLHFVEIVLPRLHAA